MRSALRLMIFASFMVTACQNEAIPPATFDKDNPLDQAAEEANLIVDPDSTSAVGLYERLHGAGTDGVCVVGEDEDDLRFGMVMHFGPTLVCEGRGVAEHEGGIIHVEFDDADCAVEVAFDGRLLRFPGAVPAGCSALCGPRASIAGGAMGRVGWTAGDARRLYSRRDVLQKRSPRTLCS